MIGKGKSPRSLIYHMKQTREEKLLEIQRKTQTESERNKELIAENERLKARNAALEAENKKLVANAEKNKPKF